MSKEESAEIIKFTRLVTPLCQNGDDGESIVDMMLTVRDFHYDGVNADEMFLEDILEVMNDAEKRGISKLKALGDSLEETLDADAEQIEKSLRGQA